MKELKGILHSRKKVAAILAVVALYLIVYLVLRYFGIDRDTLSPVINRIAQHNFFTIYLIQVFFSMTPIPDSLLTYLSVIVLGVYETFFAVYFGMLTASIMHYWIATKFGPGVVYRLFPKYKTQVENFKGKLDTHHLIIYRFFNLISFDIIAYIAAFSGIKFKKFFVATALGLIPMIIPNILFAHGLLTNNFWGTLVLWGSAGLIMGLLAFLVKKFY